ncbi:PREDICTED: B3 domain-containing protein REM10-like [Camelina sativa]|uniref:B3 domain-containing protein REM10-like n=1 Tax=Camelina sativa TaxID=90675 RepID=A0ABM0TPT6_CAMSA|nr:PREDICTED: B3 domain-containing protein REM10-like [Camelina sativa]
MTKKMKKGKMVNQQPLYSPINPHFFQPLLPDFTDHLDIPVAFFLKYVVGSNEGNTAKLRSDASDTTWEVKIDGRRLSHGWDDFAIAHDLRVGDIVVFRHEGELVFHVSALGPSCCEIQYRDDKKEKLCDTVTEKVSIQKKSLKREAADSAPDHSLDSCFVTTVTASNLRRDTLYLPKEFARSNGLKNKLKIVLMNEEGESWIIDLRHEAYPSGRFNMRRGWRRFCVANGKKPGDKMLFKLVQNEETPVLQLFPMDSEDQEKLENVPRKKSRKEEEDYSPDDCSSFVASVTTSNLWRDRMYLPKKFILSSGLSLKTFQILLMNEEGESWKIDVRHEAYSGRFLTTRGWRSFCVANDKKPGDSFIFKLVQNQEIPVLRVFPLYSEDWHKLEPSNDTRQGKCLKATKAEFLGVEVYRDDSMQGNCFKASVAEPTDEDIRQRRRSQAIKQEYVSAEGNYSIGQNRLVTLTLTPASKLNLPLEFTKANGINKAGKITMLDIYGSRWRTSLLMDNRGTMSLGKGSNGFCEVHGVKMYESFVLELIWEDTVPLLKFCSKV